MNGGSVLRIFEHQKVRVSTAVGEPGLTHDQFTALARYYDKQPVPYFKLIHQGVQFRQYVGVIRVGTLTIEILPKVGAVGDTDLWQRVLVDMLRESRLLDIRSPTQATLRLKPHSILELYIALFLDEVELLLHQGLVKSYRSVRENSTACKGRLLVHRQITQNHAHQERFYVDHPVFDSNTLLNQVLYKTLTLIPQLTNQLGLILRNRNLLTNFPAQSEVQVSAELFTGLVFNRKTEPYHPAIQIAEMLLLNYHPDLVFGRNHVLALLFDMNQVWEKFIWQRLKKSNVAELFELFSQSSQLFWGTKTIRPDIFLKRKGGTEPSEQWPNFVIDAKWKVNPTHSPADDDLKQMYVYNHHFQSSRSILVYPSPGITSTAVTHPFHLPGSGGVHHCQLCALQVVDEQGLSKRISADLSILIS